MDKTRVLTVSNDPNVSKVFSKLLKIIEYDWQQANHSLEALRLLSSNRFDIIFLDMELENESSLDLISQFLFIEPKLSVVVFTLTPKIETAVQAIQKGALDYVSKPLELDYIERVLGQVKARRDLEKRVQELEATLSQTEFTDNFITNERFVQEIYEFTLRAAGSLATILILGESGTGKSQLARAVHKQSPRRDKPFVTVACPSLSKELFESELFRHVRGAFTGAVSDKWGKVKAAEGGTLFLDEIGELPLEIQPKLLRLLQEREFERVGEHVTRKADIRVIAATNRSIDKLIETGRFREDLFHRLNVMTVEMPPLRKRPRDVQQYAEKYLNLFSHQMKRTIKGFSNSAMAALKRYPWPGNLRELRNVIERAVILATSEYIELDDLPRFFRDAHRNSIYVGRPIKFKELEREHIRRVVDSSSTITEAAQILGIDSATLYRKRRLYRDEADDLQAQSPTAD